MALRIMKTAINGTSKLESPRARPNRRIMRAAEAFIAIDVIKVDKKMLLSAVRSLRPQAWPKRRVAPELRPRPKIPTTSAVTLRIAAAAPTVEVGTNLEAMIQ